MSKKMKSILENSSSDSDCDIIIPSPRTLPDREDNVEHKTKLTKQKSTKTAKTTKPTKSVKPKKTTKTTKVKDITEDDKYTGAEFTVKRREWPLIPCHRCYAPTANPPHCARCSDSAEKRFCYNCENRKHIDDFHCDNSIVCIECYDRQKRSTMSFHIYNFYFSGKNYDLSTKLQERVDRRAVLQLEPLKTIRQLWCDIANTADDILYNRKMSQAVIESYTNITTSESSSDEDEEDQYADETPEEKRIREREEDKPDPVFKQLRNEAKQQYKKNSELYNILNGLPSLSMTELSGMIVKAIDEVTKLDKQIARMQASLDNARKEIEAERAKYQVPQSAVDDFYMMFMCGKYSRREIAQHLVSLVDGLEYNESYHAKLDEIIDNKLCICSLKLKLLEGQVRVGDEVDMSMIRPTVLEAFAQTCIKVHKSDKTSKVGAQELYDWYVSYCKNKKVETLNAKQFPDQILNILSKHGVVRVTTHGKKYYKGISLIQNDENNGDEDEEEASAQESDDE